MGKITSKRVRRTDDESQVAAEDFPAKMAKARKAKAEERLTGDCPKGGAHNFILYPDDTIACEKCLEPGPKPAKAKPRKPRAEVMAEQVKAKVKADRAANVGAASLSLLPGSKCTAKVEGVEVPAIIAKVGPHSAQVRIGGEVAGFVPGECVTVPHAALSARDDDREVPDAPAAKKVSPNKFVEGVAAGERQVQAAAKGRKADAAPAPSLKAGAVCRWGALEGFSAPQVVAGVAALGLRATEKTARNESWNAQKRNPPMPPAKLTGEQQRLFKAAAKAAGKASK